MYFQVKHSILWASMFYAITQSIFGHFFLLGIISCYAYRVFEVYPNTRKHKTIFIYTIYM